MKCQWISHIRLIKTLVTVTVWQHFCVQLKSWGLQRADGDGKTSIIEARRDGRDQNSPHFSASCCSLTVDCSARCWLVYLNLPYPIHISIYVQNILCIMQYISKNNLRCHGVVGKDQIWHISHDYGQSSFESNNLRFSNII